MTSLIVKNVSNVHVHCVHVVVVRSVHVVILDDIVAERLCVRHLITHSGRGCHQAFV